MHWMIVPYGESKSGALFQKVSQKVASFFKKGGKSDTLLIEDFRLVQHKKYFPEDSTNIEL